MVVVFGGARQWLLAFACSAVGLTAQAQARAADGPMPVRVVLTNTAGCGSEGDLLQAIQRRNARVRAAIGGERGVTLVLVLSSRGTAFHGELQIRSDDGSSSSRGVDGSTCQAVIEALSLTAALALESATLTGSKDSPTLPDASATSTSAGAGAAPSGAASPDTTTSAGALASTSNKPTTPAAAPPAATAATSPKGDAAKAPGARLAVQVGAQASVGQAVSPHLNAGGALLGRARVERGSALSPSVTLSVQHTRSELLHSAPESAVRVTGVSVAPCPVSLRPVARLRFEPCLLVTGAKLLAVGRDLPQATSATRSWWGLGALARLSLAVTGGLALELEGGALVPLVERRFVTLPSGRELGRTPTLGALANAGVSYEL